MSDQSASISDRSERLAELDRQIVEVDREQYSMARSDAPRDAAYRAKAAALQSRYEELRRQEKALKNT